MLMMMAVFMVVVHRCWQPGEAPDVDDDDDDGVVDDVDVDVDDDVDDDGCLHGSGPQVLAAR